MDPLESFAEEAERYVAWVRGGGPKEEEAAATREALVRLTRLFAAGLELPTPFTTEAEAPDISHEEYLSAVRGLPRLPFNFYASVFDPFADLAALNVPASQGMLSDDLADVWRDVESGLRAWRRGHRSAAQWAWGFNFQIHWGQHATQAMEALRAWLEANEPDRLTGGG